MPAIVVLLFFRKNPQLALRSYAVLMLGMIIDLDHLLATPIYDAGRCSIGFHPLHSTLAVGLYLAALCSPKLRLFAIGLCIHIALDSIDCL